MKRSNTILAAAFLLLLTAMAGYSLLHLNDMRMDILAAWHQQPDQETASVGDKLAFAADRAEGSLNRVLDRKHTFIQLYGAVQRATGQRFVEDNYSYSVVRMYNDTLIFSSVGQVQKDTTANADRVAALARVLGEQNVPLTAVIAPQKAPAEGEAMPAALRDFHNEEADQYLSHLAGQGVSTLDLRPFLRGKHEEGFFRTDHHWNIRGAFAGAVGLVETLWPQYGFPMEETALSGESYTPQVLEDFFLGSQGKRVGTYFAGTDDFEIWTPDFPTEFTYHTYDNDKTRTGTLTEALCYENYLVRDFFNGNNYLYFSGGDWGQAKATNHLNPDGPKVVMIRDSFACALTPFLATQCGELTTFDLRAYSGETLVEDILACDPDLVLVFYSPSTTVSDNMFAFGLD